MGLSDNMKSLGGKQYGLRFDSRNDSRNKAKNYLAHGTQEQVIVQTIGRWSENRVREQSSEDYWEPEDVQQT